MFKRIVVFCFALAMAISLSGCATFGKKKDLEIQGLKNQVSVLEAQAQANGQEISGLKEELAKANETKAVSTEVIDKGGVISSKRHPKARQIQLALKNAGYNPGKIDGRIGKQTIDAIKAFQKANNLPVTGKMDRKTWALLRESLIQKIK
ncbi:MAG: hypothetical protein COT38_04165 [Candidatus Omnitrophica bacterium CG08_land_8_20_14_0_20_41_16]|uniref:Peptidoglycan binding-like domain-containing protein n=1 Tax=Candidatus Sherwoodlollariibacterium unditelluris TaxID=1974757 RepID=A0A2G9YJZ7_9BACT|nr:MAG: hypothetical protein COX41_02235 [Candidatus Omnitrophica bacterium CG23_combo_of_CG06-09_8_20_14_all_41_10]PIS33659.1 MAG: hypothetical protein COT38_04165 [Candidatus Omnitrophica bacterium CG08_land_8_20_14_0_20_41_16]